MTQIYVDGNYIVSKTDGNNLFIPRNSAFFFEDATNYHIRSNGRITSSVIIDKSNISDYEDVNSTRWCYTVNAINL